ncbi:hypothetical protein NQ314_010885 [Rhamnusium bicolor]|uniref:DDE-1 domain-containing protein n=1 Tax=Rhamnusium bicolor TaxID=1586634 RepID=A0AAV8XM03_9CUCU|nr:hypothetical protein NQ314_010885 [Rhamnusium bicolor]
MMGNNKSANIIEESDDDSSTDSDFDDYSLEPRSGDRKASNNRTQMNTNMDIVNSALSLNQDEVSGDVAEGIKGNSSDFNAACCSTKKSKKCCENQNFEEDNLEEIGDEELDDVLIEKSIQWENTILKEMNQDLREINKLLREKNENLERENNNLKVNPKDTVNDTLAENINNITQREIITNIVKEALVLILESNLKPLITEINNLKLKINMQSDNNAVIKTDTEQKTNNKKKTSEKTTQNKKPVTPKLSVVNLISDKIVTPNQNKIKDLENLQRKIMEEVIFINQTEATQDQEIGVSNITEQKCNDEEGWTTINRRKKPFKRNVANIKNKTLVGLLNIRSITSSYQTFIDLVLERNYDIFCLTETWLKNCILDENVNINGYRIDRVDRNHTEFKCRGGGVALYFKSEYTYEVLDKGNEHDIDYIASIITLSKRIKLGIILLYKPPTVNYNKLDFLTDILDTISPLVDELLLLGDFNINILNSDQNNVKFLSDLVSAYNLSQIVLYPTLNNSIIDHVYVTNREFVTETIVEEVNKFITEDGKTLTDHNLINCFIEIPKVSKPPSYKLIQLDLITDAAIKTCNFPVAEEVLNLDEVLRIEKKLDTYEIVSLVYLLYDDAQYALQELCLLLRGAQKNLLKPSTSVDTHLHPSNFVRGDFDYCQFPLQSIEDDPANSAICNDNHIYNIDPKNPGILLIINQEHFYREIDEKFKGTPGQDWYSNFMKRHPQLSLKKAQSLQNKRAKASDPFVVGNHYKNLKRIVEENEFDQYPELFFNCDESGFCTDPSKIKSTGVKNKTLADESALPPHIIFQGCAVLPRWTGAGEDLSGTVYAATPKGYMEKPVFYSWFADHFISYINKIRETLPAARQNQKAVLMFDGHRSHISSRLVQTTLENNVILFRLPSHLTHRLQPLDFSVFGPLILLRDIRKTLGMTNKNKMTRKQFSIAVKDLWEKYLTPEIIISGLSGTSSLPVDPTKFPQSDFDQTPLARYQNSLQKENELPPDDAIPVNSENLTSSNIQTKRSATDFFIDKIKENLQSFNPPASKEKQIRLKQLKYGEVLTSEQVLQRLREEEERRQQNKKCVKRKQAVKRNKTKNSQKLPRKANTKKSKISDLSDSDCSATNELEKEMHDFIDGDSGRAVKKQNSTNEQHEDLENKETKSQEKNSKVERTEKLSETCMAAISNVMKWKTNSDQEKNDEGTHNVSEDKTTDKSTEANEGGDLINCYMAISSIKTWYIGLVLETLSAGYVNMEFLERLESSFRWPRSDKIESVSSESFLIRVVLKDDASFTVHPSIEFIEKNVEKIKKT